MADSKKQAITAIGKNIKIDASITHVHNDNPPVPEGYMLVEKEEHNKRLEEHKERLEDKLQIKELALKNAHNDEKMQLYAHIYDLKNSLANLPESLKKEQEKNAKLVALLEQMGGKVAEKKFQKAIDAFKEKEFAKADKILIEIEETEKLNKKDFGEIAYARGDIAEQLVRWHDAVEHYTRAAQLDPCFKNLLKVQKLTYNIGDYDSSISFGLAAQKAAINEHGKYSKQYARIISNLAVIHMEQKKYELAEPLHKESLKLYQDILGKKHPAVGMSLNNLGGMYQVKKQYKEATYLFKRALNINKEALGMKHPDTANFLNNLGTAYSDLGEFKKAKPLLKQALKIRKEVLGENHPNIANSYNNISGLYGRQEEYKKAEPFARQALEILESTLGPDHPRTILVKKSYEDLKKYLANT